MEKEFIPYELAVKLKALGFDKPCFAGYNPNPVNDDDLGTLIYPTIKLDFEGEDIIFNDTESDEPNCWTIDHDVILAPTYSQAFRWFREKHNIDGLLHKTAEGSYYFWITECEYENYNHYKYYNQMVYFNTYEEAELTCLEKIIEFVESKSE